MITDLALIGFLTEPLMQDILQWWWITKITSLFLYSILVETVKKIR